MTNDWDSCLDEGNALDVFINPEKVKALLNSAKRRKEFVETHEIDDNNSEILFSDMYECCLELLHTLLMNRGYKVINHLCLGYYLKDVFKSQELFHTFDKYRRLRNNVIYYGSLIDTKSTIKAIKELRNFYNRILILIIQSP